MRLLVSACLLGVACRHDGNSKLAPQVTQLLDHHQLIPVCPEQLGGLSTPRPPCELIGGKALTRDAVDCTSAFARGAGEALRLYHLLDCQAAILKARSPSCGKARVYDGSFQGVLTQGDGILARAMLDEGIPVYTEDEVPALLAWMGHSPPMA